MQTSTLPVIFLLGPTASGKTDWAISWQKKFGRIEIVSVDSVMVYKGCDIGSAKPSPETLKAHPHHLVNETSLDQIFSVADFCETATTLIEEIHQRKNIPLLVGGSMMYFNLLKNGLSSLPSADPILRAKLEDRIDKEGIVSLHDELQTLNPEAANAIKPQDTQRIIRALEVEHLSRINPKILDEASSAPLSCNYQLLEYGIFPLDRAKLHERIESRQHRLINEGLLEEVEGLNKAYQLSPEHPAMKAVNYRQAQQVLNGELQESELFERSLYATRQLAKRQCTWLRGWQGLKTYNLDELNQASEELEKQLNLTSTL